jgi:probable addiction module antidote protein
MSEKVEKSSNGPLANGGDIAGHINNALKSSDIVAVCNAIGDATRLHSISDIAEATGLERPSIYRAFGGQQYPNFSTVLRVLDAMGFQLKVIRRRGRSAGLRERPAVARQKRGSSSAS